MICPDTTPAPLRCPTFEESLDATVALVPPGDAWPANDKGRVARYLAWLAGLTSPPPRNQWPAGYVQIGWVAALASVRNYLESRLCDLRLEFWCATQTETNDQWMKEYGLPDACDPFPDLCAKVAALGGDRCEYYTAIAARAGWSITCFDYVDGCGATTGCALAGDDQAGGGLSVTQIGILVDLNNSPAYVAVDGDGSFAGALEAGFPLSCDASIAPLQCILDRVVHAEIEIIYTTH